ncbi:putative leucine-rich repeat-containing protein DDB_G0290503 [Anopheles stephensi]|uniref:Uncharacterized protein n=1 Tax=Anopheles stephensi TaxID=30069 RepID=A0A182YG44_ANOST|nr:putative leucine-rich repeat-containing protein DDB_G0290503 [Anopheles stephensi]
MADDQQQEQTPTPPASEQSATTNEMVQIVRELLYKDKNTALVKAVELLVLNIQQRQVIFMLKQTLQEAVVQTDQMLKDLHDQPVMESLLSNIETQNQSTRKQLGDKVDSIRMHMKSNEVLRKQLKKELMGFRSGIDDIKRHMHEKEEIGKFLCQSFSDTKARADELHKKLCAVSDERAKLREENHERMEQIRKLKHSCEENVRKIKIDLAEGEKELEHLLAELEAVKQQAAEKMHGCRQMVSDKTAMQQRNAKLAQQMQNEMNQLEQNFQGKKIQLDRVFVEKSDEYKQKIEELDQLIGELMNKNAEQEKEAVQSEAEVSKIADELEDVNSENLKLENELANLKASVHVNNGSLQNNPTQQFGGRARVHTLPKPAAAHVASSTDNEFDVSYHLDNEQSFIL